MRLTLKGAKKTSTDPKSDFSVAKLLDTYAVNSTVARGTPPEAQLELEADDLLELTFTDDTVWLGTPQDLPRFFEQQNRGAAADVIDLTQPLANESDARGLFGEVVLKTLRHFRPQLEAEAVTAIAHKLEQQSLTEGEGLFKLMDGAARIPVDPSVPELSEYPHLLLLHGTFSNTASSFADLIEGDDQKLWGRLRQHYQDRIWAFDHRTLSESPFTNLEKLLRSLPAGAILHLLTYSRGGLIGELLSRCEASQDAYFQPQEIALIGREAPAEADCMERINSLAQEKQIRIERFVRVGCPTQGTSLLSERLDTYLNVLLNLVPKGGTLFDLIEEFILAIVKQRFELQVLPGLAAMVPDSAFQRILNNEQLKLASPLTIIAGEAQAGGLKRTLMYLLTRFYFRTDNDYVVDTARMFYGVPRIGEVYYKLIANAEVHHGNYFLERQSRQAVTTALLDEQKNLARQFTLVGADVADRGVKLEYGRIMRPLPSGNKPVVVLLPGIMGSNLSVVGKGEVWLSYDRIAAGGLLDLEIDAAGIEASSLVKTSYAKLVNYLERQGYELLCFPYDWRKPVADSAAQLAAQLQPLLPKLAHSLQIVAHSMGGLVTRALMVNHSALWQQLQAVHDFRVILLGTPWYGSYLIPATFTGQAKTIRSLGTLSLFQKRKDLLQVFVQYPGLYELMPQEGHPFADASFWEWLAKEHTSDDWVVPDPAALTHYQTYWEQLADFHTTADLSDFIYVAGQAELTIDGICLYNRYTGKEVPIPVDWDSQIFRATLGALTQNWELRFVATSLGDGSVTWERGIPRQLIKATDSVYYQSSTHGELANDETAFPALLELLREGSTKLLSQLPPTDYAWAVGSRGAGRREKILHPSAAAAARREELLADILSMPRPPRYRRSPSHPQRAPLQVSVKAGHLKYSSYPVMLGHFDQDGIVSAEAVLDHLLNRELSIRHRLNIYPGPIGTSLVLLDCKQSDRSGLVVGLGEPELLTPYQLTTSVERAVVAYLLQYAKCAEAPPGEPVGISPLLIGSGYANLSLASAINAVLEGVTNANEKIQIISPDLPQLSHVEFIELYQAKADRAFQLLHQFVREGNVYQLELQDEITQVAGRRTYLNYDDEENWWVRVMAVRDVGCENEPPFLKFTATTGRAVIHARESYINQGLLSALLKASDYKQRWDPKLTKALFEFLVPNDFKMAFRNQQNILLILDEHTAWYPWELLHYDVEHGKPLVVRAGMVRQLASKAVRTTIRSVRQPTAIVIGDPPLHGTFSQLPGARAEAEAVMTALRGRAHAVVDFIGRPAISIYRELTQPYKIMHIACHGVVNYGENQRTGIVLSDDPDQWLDAQMISQLPYTPELVFVNCCHVGEIKDTAEALSRERYQLAASIGTQFIHSGAKAVVVAGWEVNDAAAETFALEFYDKMLAGVAFGEAVRSAREACYNQYPQLNTWGAYQCYGDQFYELTQFSKQTEKPYHFLVEQDALIALQNFTNDANSSRKRHQGRAAALARIEKGIQRTRQLQSPRVLEALAQAQATIGQYAQAVATYGNLCNQAQANFSVRAVEQWCNLRATDILLRSGGELDYAQARKEMSEVLDDLDKLGLLGETRERWNLRGGTYKRMFMLYKTASLSKRRQALLTESGACYYRALMIDPDPNSKDYRYSLGIWLQLAAVTDADKITAFRKAQDEAQAQASPNDWLDALAAQWKDATSFWDRVFKVNIDEARLLLSEAVEEIASASTNIITGYQELWRMDGSQKNLDSEWIHLCFLQSVAQAKLQAAAKKESAPQEVKAWTQKERHLGQLVAFFAQLREEAAQA